MSKPHIVLSQNMTQPARHWISKSAVARAERISRRTVQRTCKQWEQLPGEREYQVTDAKGRVNLDGFRRWSDSIKKLERRGFRRGGTRSPTRRWTQLQRALRNKKTFGRTYEDRIKIIRAEIDDMTDYQQGALLWELPSLFRPAAREFVQKQRETFASLILEKYRQAE